MITDRLTLASLCWRGKCKVCFGWHTCTCHAIWIILLSCFFPYMILFSCVCDVNCARVFTVYSIWVTKIFMQVYNCSCECLHSGFS